MSNRQARFERRWRRRDEQRRRATRIAPTEWAAMTGRQKRAVARKARP